MLYGQHLTEVAMRPLKYRILFGALLLLGASFAFTAAESPSSVTDIRAAYRRAPAIPFPADNPFSEAKSALGEMLFFDPLLSGSRARSCATCHNPSLSWADGLPRAIGEKQLSMTLRSPSLIDVGFTEVLGWDGKFADLESVAFGPIANPANMNLTEPELIGRLWAIPGYVDAFGRAFGEPAVTRRNIELALATFERTITAREAPFDMWARGEETAISAAAKRGFQLFNGKAHCSSCHSGPSFTDGSFHDIGSTAEKDDIGRGRLFPTSERLRYAFKTPTLRYVVRRAPYTHNGSVATLEEVITIYERGGIDRPSRSELIKPFSLAPAEKADLLAFLQTLTSSPRAASIPTLPR